MTEAEIKLHIARAKAIQDYASVEGVLCLLLSFSLGIQQDLAGIVFYRIVNTRSRNTIIEDILKRRFPSVMPFWTSVVCQLRKADTTRNQIIHWHTMVDFIQSADEFAVGGMRLMPPNYWTHDENTPDISLDEMAAFSAQCKYLFGAFHMLSWVIANDGQKDHPWRCICEQPAAYPPPDSHPLSLNYKGPLAPHSPSSRSEGEQGCEPRARP